MVTSAKTQRLSLIQKSLHSYSTQTHRKKELVVVLDCPSPTEERAFNRLVEKLPSKVQVTIKKPEKKLSLGGLRNFALQLARGDVICQWDDDDLYHPTRIEFQLKQLVEKGVGAVFLQQIVHYFAKSKTCYWTDWRRLPYQVLPGTLMVRKSDCIQYRKKARGEDMCFLTRLQQWTRVEALDSPPFLYVYVFHGGNTWNNSHHLRLARAASVSRRRIISQHVPLFSGLQEAGLNIQDLSFADSRGMPVFGINRYDLQLPLLAKSTRLGFL